LTNLPNLDLELIAVVVRNQTDDPGRGPVHECADESAGAIDLAGPKPSNASVSISLMLTN
jgi:hypothetical protein